MISKLLVLLLLAFISPAFSQTPVQPQPQVPAQTAVYPKIFESKTWTEVTREDIQKKLEDADVLIIGEEHDDKEGHAEKLKLLQLFASSIKYKFAISMEMLERDQQEIVNEYLSGFIDEKLFQSEMRLWQNYDSDYKPIVNFARDKRLAVIAANAPRRYTKMVSRRGLDYLYKLPQSSKDNIAPLYTIPAYVSSGYESKISAVLSSHSQGTELKNMILAQYLWDATMADSIIKHIEATRQKIVHINGRFHSDEYYGVTHRLQLAGLKVLTISMFPLRGEKKLDNTLSPLADVIYITGALP